MGLSLGYVIPTLGVRTESFERATNSILASNMVVACVIVAPKDKLESLRQVLSNDERLVFIADQGLGLASAINLGFSNLPMVDYWNWCADDDQIVSLNVEKLASGLSSKSNGLIGIGSSWIINKNEKVLVINVSHKLKISLLSYGSNLISQCACLFSYKATLNVGKLDEDLRLAFDQKIMQQLLENGEYFLSSDVTGVYEWDADTLSNLNRKESLRESYLVRLEFQKSILGKLIVTILRPITTLISHTGNRYMKLRSK
jgi:hypothetical protein